MKEHRYFIYIITNKLKTVLYIGVTNSLQRRISQHINNKGLKTTFAGRYHCCNLLYFEEFGNVLDAIRREKELKKWSRLKKEKLISSTNPNWDFLIP